MRFAFFCALAVGLLFGVDVSAIGVHASQVQGGDTLSIIHWLGIGSGVAPLAVFWRPPVKAASS